MEGRIWFPGNPWPDGHAVEEFGWWGRIHRDGRLWFELSLRFALDPTGRCFTPVPRAGRGPSR